MVRPLENLTLEEIKYYVDNFETLGITEKLKFYCSERIKLFDAWFELNKDKLINDLKSFYALGDLDKYKYSSRFMVIWLVDDPNSNINVFSGDLNGFYYGFTYKNYLRISTKLDISNTTYFNRYLLLIGMQS